MDKSFLCYVCGKQAESTADLNFRSVACPRCGRYTMTRTLSAISPQDTSSSFVLSGLLRKASDAGHPLHLTTTSVDTLIKSAVYPRNLLELIDEFLLLIYSRTHSADDNIEFDPETDYPLIYSKSPNEFRFVYAKTYDLGFTQRIADSPIVVRLDISGLERVQTLREHSPATSKIAFMAMPFGDSTLDRIYTEHFIPAIAKTGFRLKRLDEDQPAGLIDSRLRVEIRNCRFLLAELTYNNNGVYWEAGYAEGLGKPVIYLSREEPNNKLSTHFDTNHHTTVFWREDRIEQSMAVLKDIVRATLPSEAKMTDE